MLENAVILQGNTQKTFNTDGQSDPLEPGVYDVWAAGDVYLKVDKSDASDVTTTTGYLLRSGNTVPVRVLEVGERIGAAASSTTAVYYHKVG